MNLDSWIQKRLQDESTPTANPTWIGSTWSILNKSKDGSSKALSDMISDSATYNETWRDRIDPGHSANPNKFAEYTNQIQSLSPSSTFDDEGFLVGSTSKVINQMGDQTYMTKPYHNDSDYSTGWNTSTTNKLYHSANMGHMIEDVVPTSIKHDNMHVPVMVSRFHQGFTHAEDKTDSMVDMHDMARIALMDYLTDNRDRHGENFLISNDLNDYGYHDLVAIDHDYSYDYGRISDAPVHPGELYARSVFGEHLDEEEISTTDIHDLARWWTKHALSMKESFDESLGGVKDKELQDSLRKGFNDRHAALSQWASKVHEAQAAGTLDRVTHNPFGYGVPDIDPQDVPTPNMELITRMRELAQQDFAGTITGLLSNPVDYDTNTGALLAFALYRQGEMKPSDWVNALKQVSDSPFAKAFRSELINSMIQARNHITLNYIQEANKKSPFLSPVLAHHIQHNLEKE